MKRACRLPALCLALTAALSAGACRTPPVVHDGEPVTILQQHRHTRYCGHYEHEGSWYYVRGQHKHGVHCGHFLVQGVWRKRKD